MSEGLSLQFLGKNFKALLLAALLYPLERIQNIQQIQSSYANPSLQTTKSIISEAVHYGRRSYFRGLSTFLAKAALLTTAMRTTDLLLVDGERVGGLAWSLVGGGVAAISYLFFYPIEIINIRMSVQVEAQKFYASVRGCASKIKINQGLKTFYRGFGYSCLLFTAQLAILKQATTKLHQANQTYSEWQQAGLLVGALAATQLLFYPFNTIKKLYQVNGGLGHTDTNFSIVRTLRSTKLSEAFRGISTKMVNLGAYTLLYSWWLADQPKLE